jgi:hypothetical protein
MTVTRARIFEAVAASPMTTIHVADLAAAALTQQSVRLLQTGCGLGAAPGKPQAERAGSCEPIRHTRGLRTR